MSGSLGRDFGRDFERDPAATAGRASAGWPPPAPFGPTTSAPAVPASSAAPAEDQAPRRRYLVVAEEILAAIGTGRLSPGDRLPNERELADICHTSRTTVRDALLALELFGVVEVRPGSGCYVTPMGAARRSASPTMLDSVPRELLEARQQVEPAVAAICAGRLGPAELARLDVLIDECEAEGRRAAPDELETFLRLSHQFHSLLAAGCGNGILADMTRQLVDVTAHPLWIVVNALHVRDAQARAAQVAEHREILEAVRAGDGEGAADAMAEHLGRLAGDIFGRSRPSTGIHRQRPRSR